MTREETDRATRPLPGVAAARWLLGTYLLAAAALTLAAVPPARLLGGVSRRLARLTGASADRVEDVVEPVSNVLLFVPIGLLLCWALPGVWRWVVVACCVAASLGIEVTQDVFLPDRTPSRRDVLTNSAGACLGALLQAALSAWWARRARGRHPVRRE